MGTFYNICLVVAVIIAGMFAMLIFFTGKGDAMSGGGGSIRTTFKGKASFEDQVSNLTLFFGAAFMLLMILLNILQANMARA